jgi:colicin import membrane protein
MARKLKTYQTSIGFFDLAVAAPSMKAAAEAWGLKTSEFKRGFAKETHDPATTAATMEKPGVVLRRPVGSNGPFTENAKLPKDLPVEKVKAPKSQIELPAAKTDSKSARAAALAFEREQKRRELARRKEEAAREKERRRREQAIEKAERRLEQARQQHDTKAKRIEEERAALDKRSEAENTRWERQKEKLEAALRRASD